VSSNQTELPLAHSKLDPIPQSKIIFQLKSELHRLQQRDREWKMMFHMLSHDLKEPLLTLEGFSKLLDAGELEKKDQSRYIKIIREAVSSLHLLVGSLQSISKLYQEAHDFTEISLRELLHSVVTSLSNQLQKTKGRIILPPEDVHIKGDAIRLYQVFLNLLANSLKYHKKAVSPEIVISYRRDSNFHRIAIKDNGVGIEPQDLKRIFTPFVRLEDVPTDGLGLGLSIVKRIAESFGGKVLVRSQQNVGTIFTVCLPRQPQKEEMTS
jgi:signal transduction histidine kinase